MKINSKKLKKILITLICSLMVGVTCVVSVSAEDTIPTVTIDPIIVSTPLPNENTSTDNSFNGENNTINKSDSNKTYDEFGIETDILPKISLEDTASKVEKKTVQVVNMIRIGAYWAIIVAFILIALKTVFGFLGTKFTLMQGIVGMTICGFMLIAVRFAPEILQAFENWLIATPL